MPIPVNGPQSGGGTTIVSAHSITIQAGNGNTVIGAIQSWHPQSTRDATHVYELNSATSGAPVDIVPGNVKGLTIAVSRFDIYNKRMEQAFGTTDLVMLSDQTAPFDVFEWWQYVGATSVKWHYLGCWFNSLGRTLQSNDDRIVKVEASLTYLSCVKVTS